VVSFELIYKHLTLLLQTVFLALIAVKILFYCLGREQNAIKKIETDSRISFK
jgi:hypothetical protein